MFWSKHISILFYLIRAQSRSTLFPYTTLFRSKPKDMPSLVTGIAGHVKRDALVITLAAGVRTAFVEKALAGRGRVVRIMPNLACAVGEGATAFALGRSATEHDALVVEEIFGAIGRVTVVDEPMLDAVTGLSGSGPGFIGALAHSLIEG